MDPLHLFDLASRKTDWLTTRQAVIARNVANVNTPRYRAQDIEPFSMAMDKTALSLETTSSGHLALSSDQLHAARARNETRNNWEVYHSGNSVSVEEELLKAGTVSREYNLNTSVIKKFHTLLLSSVRGPT
ncbi:MAG: flagellar basal body rod protein FlgB [Pseudochelatococcus sp.]|jgi:flagellar basal-body rod protein FlgB|uniref:flagellar basal body rod protein FlgB n=1 Tax=Pseudochelatococcus sp. TaxID=2020869 RepID=UPI003D93A2BC